jgi:hypothetical protein
MQITISVQRDKEEPIVGNYKEVATTDDAKDIGADVRKLIRSMMLTTMLGDKPVVKKKA